MSKISDHIKDNSQSPKGNKPMGDLKREFRRLEKVEEKRQATFDKRACMAEEEKLQLIPL